MFIITKKDAEDVFDAKIQTEHARWFRSLNFCGIWALGKDGASGNFDRTKLDSPWFIRCRGGQAPQKSKTLKSGSATIKWPMKKRLSLSNPRLNFSRLRRTD